MTEDKTTTAADPQPSRQELYERVQWALAGGRAEDVIGALVDSLAAAVGFSADDQAHGERLLQSLAGDAVASMRRNWGYLSEMKAATRSPIMGSA